MQNKYLTRSGVSFPATAAPRSRWAFSGWLLLCLMAGSAVVSGQTITFGGTTEVPVGITPYSVAAADVDRDGDLDLLAANVDGNSVSVRFNNGAGTFGGSPNVPVGTAPYSVVAADVDRDGDLDLLTANFGSNTVSVRFNNGSSGFGGTTEVSVGDNPISVAAADVDGDGDLDIITANYGNGTASVRLNNGAGAFTGNTNITVGTSPHGVVAADVDGDGDLDLLVANYMDDTVSVRFNNGSGAFSGGAQVGVGAFPISIAAADVDGDGDPDLLASNYFANTVSVRINNGSGAFSGNTGLGVGASPYRVVAADMDDDGDPDLLTANAGGSSVSVRLNDGSGVFGGTTNVAVGANPYGVAAADVDRDGDLDILAANGTSNTVSVRLNQTLITATTTSLVAATTTYGSTAVNLIAAVAPVPTGGSVQFFLKDYPTAGTNTAIGTASRGADNTFTLSYNPGALDAKGYTVIARYGGSAPFTASEGNGLLNVNRKAASVTPHALSKVYGEVDPPLTGTLEGFLARDQVTAAYSRIAGETVNRGPYQISATLGPAGVLGNYAINYKTADFTITPRPLTVTATAKDKVYDGNTTAQVTLTDNRVPNDEISVLFTSAAFADKNAGTGKTVTVNGLSIMGIPGNYSLAGPAVTTTADITPKPVTGSFTAASKTYDGTDVAVVVNRSLNGVVLGDQVLLTGGTARFPGKNVGSAVTVTLTGAALTGAQAGNYSLGSVATTLATIMRKDLIPAITAEDKVYDGRDNATIKTRSVSDVVAGDQVDLVGGAAFFENRNVGQNKLVQAGGFSLSGADAINYNIYLPTVTTRAAITPLAVTGTFKAFDKEYDGNTSAQVQGSGSALVGVVVGDAVTLTGGTASFSDKNVGNGKTVTLTGATLTGGSAGNYSLGSVAPTTASITPKLLFPAITAQDKVYDGTTRATLSSQTVSGLLNGETAVTLVVREANFFQKNVSASSMVEASGLSLAGADASNYALIRPTAATQAAITPRPLTAASTVAARAYDGTTAAGAVTIGTVTGLVGAETLNISATASNYADANVGTNKATTITYTLLDGTNGGWASNYSMAPLATTGQITARPVTVTADAKTKVYGENDPALTYRITSGSLVNGDVFTGAIARVAGEAVGAYDIGRGSLTITRSGNNVSDNYALTFKGAQLSITARPITITANDRTKTYGDALTLGTTAFTVSAGNLVYGNTVTGVTLTSAGAAANATVTPPGPNYAIVASNAVGTGLGNYAITYANGTLTVKPAEATVGYAGLEYFATPTAASTSAKVEYIATITDARPNSGGDVSTSSLTFNDGQNNATRNVVLLDGANKRVGSARTGIDALTVSLSKSELSAGGKSYDLSVNLPAGNYTGALAQRTVITVAVPGQDFVNGGGNLLMSNSGGKYAAPAGSKMNFGFTMKWNASGKNIQGQANIIFRSGSKVYQIRSNAINTLGTSTVSGGRRADFNTKANLTDVTNPLAPVPVVGNLDLSVQAFESTASGGKPQISVTLRNGNQLWFSSAWDGTRSVMRDLTGGAIRVRNTNTPTAGGRQGAEAAARSAETSAFTVNAYPNPFADKFYLSISREVTGDVAITVADGKGRTVTRQVARAAGQEGARTVEMDLSGEPHGVYLLHVQSGARREVIKVFKQNR